MFWGITLEGGKRYSQTVATPFHISMAALEYDEKEAGKNKVVSVMIEHKDAEFLLCSLQHGKCSQQVLDLNFIEDEIVTFFILGTGTVHLTGYLDVPQDVDELNFEEGSSEEEEDEDEDVDDDTSVTKDKGLKRKRPEEPAKTSKQFKMENAKKEVNEDDDESSDESDTVVRAFYKDLANKKPAKKDIASSPIKSPKKAILSPATSPVKESPKPEQKKGMEAKETTTKTEIVTMDVEKDDDEETAITNGTSESTPLTASQKKKMKKKLKKLRRQSEGEQSETVAQTPKLTPQMPSAKIPKVVPQSLVQTTPKTSSQTPAKKTPNKSVQKLKGGTAVEDFSWKRAGGQERKRCSNKIRWKAR